MILTILSILMAGCTSAPGGPTEAPSLSGGPSTSPTRAIEHAIGPTDLLLRFEEGGGFVAPNFRATQAPIFTLYGDGTAIFRNPAQDPLPPVGSVSPFRPFRIAHLTEDQIQDVLADAVGRGGLGTARTDYPNNQVANAPTARFTIHIGGIDKGVSIYALGIDVDGLPDAPARAAFASLAARLAAFDNDGALGTSEDAASRYRGILLDGQAGTPGATPWP